MEILKNLTAVLKDPVILEIVAQQLDTGKITPEVLRRSGFNKRILDHLSIQVNYDLPISVTHVHYYMFIHMLEKLLWAYSPEEAHETIQYIVNKQQLYLQSHPRQRVQ